VAVLEVLKKLASIEKEHGALGAAELFSNVATHPLLNR
jgi:hypothetical protein